MIVFVLGIIIGLLTWGIATLVSEGSNLLDNLGTYFTNASQMIQKFLDSENLKKLNIPENVVTAIERSATELLNTAVLWLIHS